MDCYAFDNLRHEMFNHLSNVLNVNVYNTFLSLSNNLKLYVLLGLDFPCDSENLELLRCYSAYYIHKIDKLRLNLE